GSMRREAERMSNTESVAPDYGDDALTEAMGRSDIDAERRETPSLSLVQRLLLNRDVAVVLAGVVLFVFFSLATDTFLTEFNLTNMLRNVSLIGVVAVGMTFLLIVGEIDLSVGSALGLLVIV